MKNYPMAELQKIETGPSLVFDVLVAGPADGPLVLLLHGFAESFHMWRSQLPALASAGYRAVAPSSPASMGAHLYWMLVEVRQQ